MSRAFKTFWLVNALVLAMFGSTFAQSPVAKTISTTVCTSPASAGCAVFDVAGLGTAGIQITGTFVGTIVFEQTVGGVTYDVWHVLPNGSTSYTSTTADPGIFVGTIAAKQIRVSFAAYTSGSAVVSMIGTQAKQNTITNITGPGVPGGSTHDLQFNAGGGDFGGVDWSVNGSKIQANQVSGTWLQNIPVTSAQTAGNFTFTIGRASNDADARPDNTASIGWNADAAASGALPNLTAVGSSQLSFEDYCSVGTGCLAGDGGQSETYFAMSDGKGGDVRPLGFFQRKFQNDVDHYLYTIARSDTWGFYDADQTYSIFSIDDNAGAGVLRTFDSTIATSGAFSGTFITIAGNSALGKGSNGIEVGNSAGVDLSPAGDGSAKVRAMSNHFQTTSGDIEDTSDSTVRITLGAGSAATHPAFQNATGELTYKPLGSSTNIDMIIQTKGSGIFSVNPGVDDNFFLFRSSRQHFGTHNIGYPSAGTFLFWNENAGDLTKIIVKAGDTQGVSSLLEARPFGSNTPMFQVKSDGTVDTTGGFSVSGVAGVTASGTTCTITAITKGIITAAVCTP